MEPPLGSPGRPRVEGTGIDGSPPGPAARRGSKGAIAVLLLLLIAFPPLVLGLSPGAPDSSETTATPPPAPVNVFEMLIPFDPAQRRTVVLTVALTTAVILAAGIGTAILGVIIFLPRRPRRSLPDRARWGIVDAVVLALVSLTLAMALQALFPGLRSDVIGVPELLIHAIWLASSVLIVFAWLHHLRGAGVADLGLHRDGWLSSLVRGPLVYLTWLPLIRAAGGASLLLYILLTGAEPPGHPLALTLIDPETPRSTLVAAALVAVGISPLLEEILFRGFLYPAFRNLTGPPAAILLTSAVFAVAHPIGHFYPLLVLGAAMAYVYERTGNILAPVAIHALQNGLIVTVLLLLR